MKKVAYGGRMRFASRVLRCRALCVIPFMVMYDARRCSVARAFEALDTHCQWSEQLCIMGVKFYFPGGNRGLVYIPGGCGLEFIVSSRRYAYGT